MLTSRKVDAVIIGGGITGAAIARELSKYKLDIILVEKQPDVSMGTSKANSAIIHAGFDAPTGSVKAKLNVRGNELYHRLADDLDLEVNFMGSLVVAKDDNEREALDELIERGRKNGVPDLEILPPEEVLRREPNLAKDIKGALWAPTAGIICPFGAVYAFADSAVLNGVTVVTECEVTDIVTENDKVVGVQTNKGFIAAKYVIIAAGINADDLARQAGDNSYTIKPRKGEYILFDRKVGKLVNTVIFPTPTKISKGILVSPTVHGNLFIGPNAQNQDDKEDVSTTPQGLCEIVSGAKRLVPDIPMGSSITLFAGLRATADTGDFVIKASDTIKGLIHAGGIQSPGFTSAPAIAEMVCDILKADGLELKEKTDFNPKLPRRERFSQLSINEQQKLIKENPLYGRIICRCETVTEAEIVAAIHAPIPAVTVDAVKRRTRAGTGRCQGGFCGPRVTNIIARELNIPITAVRKDTCNSYLFYDKIPAESEAACHD